MSIHSRPPEEWALRTAEIWSKLVLLGGWKGHIDWENLHFIQRKLYFSPLSLFFFPNAMTIHSPCSVRLCFEEDKGSYPQLFSLVVSALHCRAGLGWSSLYTWSLPGLYLLEKFSPLAGYREGLQLRQSWDFVLSFLGFFFFITKRTNWFVSQCMKLFIIVHISNPFCGGSHISYEDRSPGFYSINDGTTSQSSSHSNMESQKTNRL